jgi:hypothetical protein
MEDIGTRELIKKVNANTKKLKPFTGNGLTKMTRSTNKMIRV